MDDLHTDESPRPEAWCRGMRRTRERPLAPHERGWITALRHAHGRRALTGMLLASAMFVIAVRVVSLPVPGNTWVRALAATCAFSSMMLFVPMALLIAWDHVRRARRLAADLAAGEAWEFAPRDVGTRAADTPERPFTLLPHARRELDPANAEALLFTEDLIEVQPHTGANLYAPLSLVLTQAEPGRDFAQRALSREERTQLRMVWPQLMQPSLEVPILGGLLAIMLLALGGRGRPLSAAEWPSLALLVLAGTFALARYLRQLVLARRLRRDLELNLAIRVSGGDGPELEVLPTSRLVLRADGAPSPWRDDRTVVERLRDSAWRIAA